VVGNHDYKRLIYEAQADFTINRVAEKYVCSITKKGKTIDKILVASINYSSSVISVDGYRIPWFLNAKSFINTDMTITFDDENSRDCRCASYK